MDTNTAALDLPRGPKNQAHSMSYLGETIQETHQTQRTGWKIGLKEFFIVPHGSKKSQEEIVANDLS